MRRCSCALQSVSMSRSACLACALCDLFTHVDVHACIEVGFMHANRCVNCER